MYQKTISFLFVLLLLASTGFSAQGNRANAGEIPAHYEYLIISRPDLVDNWDPLIQLNKRRGLRTKVVSIAAIDASGEGRDLAEKMRNFIKEEYEKNLIVFVLLGGDVVYGPNNIPTRLLNAKFYDYRQTPDRFFNMNPAADMYFGTLDGDWDANGNGVFGEPGEEDFTFEVWVSRMCVDNAEQLVNILNKTIKYAEDPILESAYSYLGLGEFLWTMNGVDVWGADLIDQYTGTSDNNGHTTYGIPDYFSLNRLDDRTSGFEGAWDWRDLGKKVLETKPSWIITEGHGNADIAFGISSRQIPEVFTNDGENANFFIAFANGCNAGQFHKSENCFMETLLSTETGAVAGISNSDYTIVADDGVSGATTLLTRYTIDALFNPDKARVPLLGAMHAKGKEALKDLATDTDAINKAPFFGLIRYSCYTSNMFGDPALYIWTEKPKTLSQQSFTCSASPGKFSMNTPHLTNVALADVSTGEIFAAQVTGKSSSDAACLINDETYTAYAANNDKVKVIISSPNCLPSSFELDIAATGIHNNLNNAVQGYSVMPMKGHLQVTFNLTASENVNLSIYNAKGTLVKTVTQSNVKDGLIKIDNSEFSNGIYFCKLITRNAQLVESFVISK